MAGFSFHSSLFGFWGCKDSSRPDYSRLTELCLWLPIRNYLSLDLMFFAPLSIWQEARIANVARFTKISAIILGRQVNLPLSLTGALDSALVRASGLGHQNEF